MDSSTDRILSYFEELSAIPRCSANEAQVAQWLRDWAETRGFDHQSDTAGNLVIRVAASKGHETAPTLVIQGHMDMVCEKTPESPHDFDKDSIRCVRRGDWLMAQGTTLGADNGIAIAYALALAEDNNIVHPSLELLFTVDEERGLSGVKKLDADMVTGRVLINLDSEDEGVFTVGCAGGTDTRISMDFKENPMPQGWRQAQVVVGGLKGGHSGIDINKHRGNANKLMARILSHVRKSTAIGLISLNGGSRHNAIPRDAQAVIAYPSVDHDRVQKAIQQIEHLIRTEFGDIEKDFFLKFIDRTGPAAAVLNLTDTDQLIRLIVSLPNGMVSMSALMNGLVETSCNLAVVSINAGQLRIAVSQRGSCVSRLDEIIDKVQAVAHLAGATAQKTSSYAAWLPNQDSVLLKRSKQVYKGLYQQDPVIQVIHAGLECAVIGDLCPGTDMISFGPTIRDAHSPDERLNIPSVERVRDFLVELLKQLA